MPSFRLVLTSDLHGSLPEKMPDGDFLLISGDITPGRRQLDLEVNWFNQVFVPWLDGQPHRHKVFIAGNHDFALEKRLDLLHIHGHGIYLQDSTTVLDGVKIHGSPWSVKFFDWAFMKEDDKLAWYWEQIPDDTQILLVHGPPHGVLDRVPTRHYTEENEHLWPGGESAGSKSLLARLENLRSLRLCQFGHIHECFGTRIINGVNYVNATHFDARHEPGNPPVVIDMEF